MKKITTIPKRPNIDGSVSTLPPKILLERLKLTSKEYVKHLVTTLSQTAH